MWPRPARSEFPIIPFYYRAFQLVAADHFVPLLRPRYTPMYGLHTSKARENGASDVTKPTRSR